MQKTLERVSLNVLDIEVDLPVSDISVEYGRTIATAEDDALTVPGAIFYLKNFREHFEIGPNDKVNYDIDGVKKSIEVWQIPLRDPEDPGNLERFNLLRLYSLLSPAVFVSQGPDKDAKLGMLTPHFNSEDNSLLSGIKVMIPKRDFVIVHGKDGDLKLQADQATLVAASAASEEADVGSHKTSLGKEPEHVFTALGQASLGNTTIRGKDGKHIQDDGSRDIRGTSSLDYDLSIGRLGYLYTSEDPSELFLGYDMPVIFEPNTLSEHDVIYIPKALASRNEGYGVYWNEKGVTAVERKLVVALENVYNRNTKQQTSRLIRTMLENA